MKGIKKKLQRTLLPTLTQMKPVINTAAKVASFAVRLQKPSVMGTIGLVSTGLDVAIGHLAEVRGPSGSIQVLVSKGQVLDAVTQAGARTTSHDNGNGDAFISCSAAGLVFTVYPNGTVYFQGDDRRSFIEWLRQALSRVLPEHLEVRASKNGDTTSHEACPIALTRYDNPQATRILNATLPLLEGGRCILLDGRPGVGKTTLAQIIARESRLGRVVMLGSSIVGVSLNDFSPHSGNVREGLAMLDPGVVIVDDIDKVSLSLERLEALRAAAKLVILTANNGQYDDVLDGAMIRAGRVDEVFSIEPVTVPRETPYDRLSDEEWEEVKEWPVAYLTEVRKRLQHRPGDLRLDDLRSRLTRKTRSGNALY